ncbi:maleylpyruvate isomerase family mycothiol-dependent enzyme [Amycolatopsis magusensis]|uniref:maleylpyruvate isomerase family mycothiol-dependent enzyme n=1 Tax=Amycolatopsis magusensis TaxID=882444 RepID=UPI003C2C07CA
MNREQYTAELAHYGTALAAAATELSRPVPSCPDWTVADLVWHTCEVFYFWRLQLSGLVSGPENYLEPKRPAEEELLDRYADNLRHLVEAVRRADPSKPVWTWSADKTAGFVQRRMAHEAAVHAWDALLAAGRDEPIGRDLAVDGIDEFLTHFLHDSPAEDLGGSVHLHATDGPGEWTIAHDGDGWQVTREHGKGTAAARASASDLLLLLWQRRDVSAVETFGDPAVLARLLKSAHTN